MLMSIVCKKIANLIKSYQIDDYDIYAVEDNSRLFSAREGYLEDINQSLEVGYAIRVVKNGSNGLAYGTNLTDYGIKQVIEAALSVASTIAPDPEFMLCGQELFNPSKLEADNSYEEISLNTKKARLLELEDKIMSSHPSLKKIEKLTYSEGLNKISYLNKFGLFLEQKNSFFGFSGEVIAIEGEEMESGSGFGYSSVFKNLNIDEIAKYIAEDAYKMIGSKPIKSGIYSVIFNNDVSADFWSTFFDLFSAEQVQNKKSILAGKLGEIIAVPFLSIFDDPLIPNTLGQIGFDGEGVEAKRTLLVEKGVLNTFLYDLKTAHKDKVKSTGNALRSGYDSRPLIKPTNFVIESEQATDLNPANFPGELLVVTNVMGMHTANSITGEFSVGASGYLFSDGELVSPVKQITLAGNFLEIMKKIQAIGDDYREFPSGGNFIVPSMLIKEVSVSGL